MLVSRAVGKTMSGLLLVVTTMCRYLSLSDQCRHKYDLVSLSLLSQLSQLLHVCVGFSQSAHPCVGLPLLLCWHNYELISLTTTFNICRYIYPHSLFVDSRHIFPNHLSWHIQPHFHSLFQSAYLSTLKLLRHIYPHSKSVFILYIPSFWLLSANRRKIMLKNFRALRARLPSSFNTFTI